MARRTLRSVGRQLEEQLRVVEVEIVGLERDLAIKVAYRDQLRDMLALVEPVKKAKKATE